jgi:hypothetical protein
MTLLPKEASTSLRESSTFDFTALTLNNAIKKVVWVILYYEEIGLGAKQTL